MATFGQDNTDSNISGPKFYLGKITGQSNIGARDSLGNPIPYYSKDDIGTIQSSAMLQDFHESEFKKAQFSPNTPWITYINTLSDTTSLVILPSLIEVTDFSWGLGANDRETELNFLNKLLSYKGTMVDLSAVQGPFIPFGDLYRSKIKNIFEVANPAISPLMADTATMWEMIEGLASAEPPYSTLETQTSVETRFPRVTTDNLYEAVNQLIADTYDMQRDMIYNKNYGDLTSVFYQVTDAKRNFDDIIGDVFDGPGGSVFQTLNLAPIGYANLTSGVVGNYNLIQNLNLTGIGGFPTDYISGQFLQANDNGLEFVTIEDPVFEFTGLSDTPSSITPLKYVRGNQLGDALEFGGINFLSDVDDRPTNLLTSGYLQLTDQNTLIWSAIPSGSGTTNYNFSGSEYFTGLKDTPNNYDLNKFIRSTNAGLEYVDINGGVVSFLGLSDTPSNFTADKYLKINSSANAVEYVDIPSPSVDFTGLLDTPIDYTNASNKYLRVNSTSNGIEFIDISGQITNAELDWDNYLRFGDLPSPSDHRGMLAYVHIDEGGGNSGSLYFSHGNAWVQFFPWVPNIGFSGLTDTPNDYAGHSGKYLKVSDNESGLEYTNLPDPVVDFTGLTDTPTSFAGQSKKYLQVNSAEDSLEFVDPLFSTGSFVGFGGAVVFKGLENTAPVNGWNDRQITSLQGYSGIKGVTLNNNQITLPGGKYLIDAEGGVFRSEATRIGIEFTAGDYVGQLFESRSNYAGTAVGNREGGARGSVKAVVQSNNPMTFKVRSFISDAASVTTFEYAHTDVSILDLGGDRDVLSITGLRDTPNSFDGASGKFIQINDNEDGVEYNSLSGQISSQEIDWLAYSTVSDLPSASDHHGMFAHVHSEGAAYMAHAGNWEKIYPVNAGSLTFTGLSDTPNAYDDGKILQSTANGLEWVDMPAGGGGSSANAIFSARISANGTIVSQTPEWIESCTRTNVGFYDIVYKSSYFTEIPSIVVTADVRDGVSHAIAEYNDPTINSITVRTVKNNDTGGVDTDFTIIGHDIAGGGGNGGGTSLEFCRAQVSSSSRIGHFSADVDLDVNQLATGSENWIYTDTTRNTVGILVPEDGLYDVSFNIRPVSPNNTWRDNVSFLHTSLCLVKADGTNVIIQETRESKQTGNGTILNCHLYLDNLSLDQGDFLYLRCRVYSNNTSLSWAVDDRYSFLSISKPGSGGGGGGGGSSTFAGLTDTPSTLTEGSGQYLKVSDDGQTIEYVDLPAGSVGGGATSTINQIQENIDNIPLIGSGVQIPDAILIKDSTATTTNGNDNLIQLDFGGWLNSYDANGNITSQHFAYETNNFVTKRWYIKFDSTDGSYIFNSADQHVKKEFNSIQEYISNDRALYFGGGGSSTFSASSYQENILQGHLSTDNDANLNDLHFTGLETGAYYRLGGQARFVAGSLNAGTNMFLYAYQDSFTTDNTVAALNHRAGGPNDPVNATHTFNHIFQATGDLFFAVGGMNSSQNRYIYGDGNKTQTYVQLEKLGGSSNGDGGSSTFAGLTDTPSTLTEGSGQYLKVSDDGQTIEYVDLPAGSSSSTDIVFESDITSMVGTVNSFVNVPHVPTTDTYTAWDSSNNFWVAPKSMTVLVNCNHQAQNDHQHLFGSIKVGNTLKAQQSSIKGSTNTNDSTINLSAVIELQAGDEVSSQVNVQGAGASTNLNRQIMTITELGGGSSNGGGGSSSNNIFGARIQVDSNNVVTIVSQTSDFIESINHDSPGNNFEITFKDGIFTEPPIAQFTAYNKNGSQLEGAIINSTENSGTDYANGKKIVIKWELVGASSFDGNQTNGNYGADLLFIKNGDDFSSNGGGSSSGGESSTGDAGIGENAKIKNHSNFYQNIPDKILLTNTNEDFVVYEFSYITDTIINYAQVDNHSNDVLFHNDTTGGYNTHNVATHSGDSPSTSLSGFIEQGRAIYLGGAGSSSQGGGSNILAQGTYYAGIQELRNDFNISGVTKIQDGNFDIVFDTPIPNREYNALVTPIGTSLINAHVDSNDENGIEIITRHNDSHARTDASFDFVVFGISGAGGGGGSSTFAGLTDTPSTLTEGSGQYLKVSDDGQTIEYVDLPAGSVGGIGDSAEVISSSNFGSKIPDVILLHPSNAQNEPRSYYFFGIDLSNSVAGGVILYRSNANEQLSFVNNSAGDYDATLTNTNHVRYAGDTNLQSIIDNGHAIYLGGGNSSTSNGGIGSDPGVIAKSNFSEPLPDRINVPLTRSSNTQERYFTFEGFFTSASTNDDLIQYEWNIGGEERFTINFKNNANGDWDGYTEINDPSNTDVDFSKIPSAITNQPTLKEFIDANRAIYLGGGNGGGGTSSTSSEVHTIQGQWTTSTNVQPAFDSLTSGAQYLIGGTVGFGGDMSNLRVQFLSGTIGNNLNNSYSLVAAGGAVYDFSHIASFSQIITATGSRHELEFESIGTVTSTVSADYQLYAKKA